MTTSIYKSAAIGVMALLLAACQQDDAQESQGQSTGQDGQPGPTSSAREDQPELISRELIFGNPQRSSGRVSPDGRQVSWLAPAGGVLNVWVGPTNDPASARAVTNDTNRGIRRYFWAYTNNHIIYLQDKGGDENWRVYSVNLETGEEQDLTPFDGVNAQIQEVSPEHPEEILVALNRRDPAAHDVHRINIATGEMERVEENTQGFAGYVTDHAYEIRLAQRFLPDGGIEYLKRNQAGEWERFLQVPQADSLATTILGFDASGQTMYMLDSRDRNTAALTATDLETGETTVLHQNENADVSDAAVHPKTYRVQATASDYLRKQWTVIDDEVKGDFEYLATVDEGELDITMRTQDDNYWVVGYEKASEPYRYYLYDRIDGTASFLFTTRPALRQEALVEMHPVKIESRDGLELVSYLSLPPVPRAEEGSLRPESEVPMVLFVHGGPWGRDEYGYHSYHQWLANRGYAVLSVNFRGSTGLGKDFINAGDKEWAAAMHNDLIDAVDWAVEEGITTEDQVAIMGGSYGGYATLVGLTFTPDRFACGVDIVGPSNLITLLESIPPYWKPIFELFANRVGDPRTEAGKALLEERSPLTHTNRISKPLLIGQGANDPRVKQAESDQIVKAMQEKDIPVTYVLFPDEGHGFARPENRLAFNAVAESFLAECLGGYAEPIGDDFEGSSIQVPEGAGHVPGVQAALDAMLEEPKETEEQVEG